MSKIEIIPLDQLALSDVNARSGRKADDVESMAASLLDHGQLQNLVGHKEKGLVHIAAGGTRLEAFQLLAERDQIKPNHGVAVKVTSKAKATEASLAENIKRTDMHPADQLNAFEALLGSKSPDEIATSFGFPVGQVRRILKLTGVSAPLRQRFAQGDINMEAMQALSLFETHEAQEDVMVQSGGNAHRIRAIWRARGVVGHSEKAKFVGEDDYRAAGGTLEDDIFTTEVIFKDPELLETLFEKKLTAVGASLRDEGWAWVEFTESQFPHYPNRETPTYVWDSEESESRAAELAASLEAAQQATDCEEPPEGVFDTLAEAESAVEEHEEAHWVESFTDEQKARSGATYRMTSWGLRIERGIVKAKPKSGSAGGTDVVGEGSSEPAKSMPDTVKETLTDLHSLALQERIAHDSKGALALFIAKHFDELPVGDNGDSMVMYRYLGAAAPCKVRLETFDGANKDHLPESAVYSRLDARGCELVAKAPALESADELLPWLMSLEIAELLPMFAFIMARSLSAFPSGAEASPLAEMQKVMGYDVTDSVELTFDNFYSRLKRPQLMALLSENDITEGIEPKWKVKELARFAADQLGERGFVHPFFQ